MTTPSTVLLPTVLGISAAFPPHTLSQEELLQGLFQGWYQDILSTDELRSLFQNTRVKTRRMVWDPRVELAGRSPGTGDRVARFEQFALDVAGQTMAALLKERDRQRIGSMVMASCTGYGGPTADLLLAKAHGLRSSLRRTFVGHMGCFAAFNAIKVAMDALAARPDDWALVNCTEASSLHFRPEISAEQAVIHALFGDASASLLLCAAPVGAGPQLLGTHTEQLYQTSEMMTWHVQNDGFRMTLSPYVPFALAEHIVPFAEALLRPFGLSRRDVRHWGIHPGGPKILDLVQARLGLSPAQLRPSFEVLARYGNCSSVTALLVLEDILKVDRPQPGEYGVLMAFGPGLTMESLLMRF